MGDMGDHPNSNMYPNNIQYSKQDVWDHPQTLPQTDQHTSTPLSMNDRDFGYESHPNLPQLSSEPANQYPNLHMHGSGLVQPRPRQWDSDTATQFPSHSDAGGRTPGLDFNTGGGNGRHSLVQHPNQPVAPMDGLDECDGDKDQSRVIRLLYTLSTISNTRVVVASCPEFAVMAAVAQKMLGILHVDLNKGDTGDDIYKFVWAELLDIRKKASRLKMDPLRWPSEEDALKISDYSSGQFILAAVAMRYVGERRHDPQEHLKEVLALCGPGGNDLMSVTVPSKQPLEPLDKLFTGILVNAGRNANPDDCREGQLKLSSLVWTLVKIVGDFWLWAHEESQGLPAGSIVHELSDLHSLLEVPEDPYQCREIRPHHKSFLDFLGDPRRSGHLGNIPQVAKERFDQTIKDHLSLLTAGDLKNLALAQPVKPCILHHLDQFYKPETVIQSIDPKVWKALLPLLNAWETLALKAWVYLTLPGRDPWRNVGTGMDGPGYYPASNPADSSGSSNLIRPLNRNITPTPVQ
ncbi:hypothetical protein FA13DRAFT_1797253 [Coprinellus micaceus]|uniref:Uncharacterized protein n=1 Tax=Coprinellus micaceus TaxID=71717 RepID=A0A4Y7SSY4_COPMI|nr:hypothetical protein FA13DRAFT_1797253 [Coprinellus micaceus]